MYHPELCIWHLLFQQREIAESLQSLGVDTQLELLPSPQGHDAFLVDQENFSRVIGGYFKQVRAADKLD